MNDGDRSPAEDPGGGTADLERIEALSAELEEVAERLRVRALNATVKLANAEVIVDHDLDEIHTLHEEIRTLASKVGRDAETIERAVEDHRASSRHRPGAGVDRPSRRSDGHSGPGSGDRPPVAFDGYSTGRTDGARPGATADGTGESGGDSSDYAENSVFGPDGSDRSRTEGTAPTRDSIRGALEGGDAAEATGDRRTRTETANGSDRDRTGPADPAADPSDPATDVDDVPERVREYSIDDDEVSFEALLDLAREESSDERS